MRDKNATARLCATNAGRGGLMHEEGRMTTGAFSRNVGKVIIRTQVGNR